MEVIKIPKAKILELIKKDSCTFYEQESYTDIKVTVVESRTDLEGEYLYISSDALATLLFDKIYSDRYLTVLVV